MYTLTLLLPLISFFIISLGGYHYGRELSWLISVLSLFSAWILGIIIFFEVVLSQGVVSLDMWYWIILEKYQIKLGMYFDSLTSIMIIIITSISICVHFYSFGYMSEDPHLTRFMAYLSLFTFFMLFLVVSDNFVQMFIGWEGVGICSYLLINFWYQRILANKAALKAMIMNRIADVFLLLGIILILITCKTSDYIVVFSLSKYINNMSILFLHLNVNLLALICFFLLFGAIGKSAQVGLHTWLPDAMEGPTPVSALLHAATMVTAGVFLVIRCSPLFDYANNILFLISLIGGLTALFSAMIGVFQYDIKKIIAYSTCSQLGYMFFSCGLSNYQVAIFHLFNHAFFKALLFLSAGSIIHSLLDEQDIRKMGGLVNFVPFTYFSIFIGSLAIMGFPFLTGFYSKDLVLELAYSCYIIDGFFIYFLGVAAAYFTAVYSVRLIMFVFFFKTNLYRSYLYMHEGNIYISLAMFALSFGSIFIGFVFSDALMGWGSFFWNSSIFILPHNFNYIDSDFVSPIVKNIPTFFSFFGMFVGISFIYLFNVFNESSWITNFITSITNKIFPFFYFSGFFNALYNNIYKIIFNFSYTFNTKIVDKGYLEIIGPYGFYRFFYKCNEFIKNLSPSVVFFSVCYMFLGLCLIILFWFFHASFFIILSRNFGLTLLFFIIILWDTFIKEYKDYINQLHR